VPDLDDLGIEDEDDEVSFVCNACLCTQHTQIEKTECKLTYTCLSSPI